MFKVNLGDIIRVIMLFGCAFAPLKGVVKEFNIEGEGIIGDDSLIDKVPTKMVSLEKLKIAVKGFDYDELPKEFYLDLADNPQMLFSPEDIPENLALLGNGEVGSDKKTVDYYIATSGNLSDVSGNTESTEGFWRKSTPEANQGLQSLQVEVQQQESEIIPPEVTEVPNISIKQRTPEKAPETPELTLIRTPVSPEKAPETPELEIKPEQKVEKAPEKAPETPEKAPETPEKAPETPEKAPETPEKAPETPEKAPEMPQLEMKSEPEPEPEKASEPEPEPEKASENNYKNDTKDTKGNLRNNGALSAPGNAASKNSSKSDAVDAKTNTSPNPSSDALNVNIDKGNPGKDIFSGANTLGTPTEQSSNEEPRAEQAEQAEKNPEEKIEEGEEEEEKGKEEEEEEEKTEEREDEKEQSDDDDDEGEKK